MHSLPDAVRATARRPTHRLRAIAVAALLLLAAGCGPAESPPAADVDAVVLIVVDTMRPDRLSCYGYQAHETRAMDAMATSGALFRNAQSVASWTGPSVGAMLTSRYPSQLGLVEKEEPGRTYAWNEPRHQVRKTIPAGATTLAELLKQHGFRTAAFVNQPALLIGDGFAQGFDEWYYPATPEEIRRWDPSQPVDWETWRQDKQVAGIIDGGLVFEMVKWMAAQPDGKLFVYLHLLTPHAPYQPLPGFLPENPKTEPTISDLYDAEIRMTDRLIGRVTDAVRARYGARAAVLLTSDHGESLGEHGMFEHGHTLHGEVTRVPLIVDAPGVPAGTVVDSVVRSIDVFPTVVDLALGPKSVPDDAEGASLLPLIRAPGEDRPAYSEAMLYGSTERSLVEGRYKLMWDEQGDTYALYDEVADPGETDDLARRDPSRVQRMMHDLHGIHDRLQPESLEAEDEGLGKEASEALRALGYVH